MIIFVMMVKLYALLKTSTGFIFLSQFFPMRRIIPQVQQLRKAQRKEQNSHKNYSSLHSRWRIYGSTVVKEKLAAGGPLQLSTKRNFLPPAWCRSSVAKYLSDYSEVGRYPSCFNAARVKETKTCKKENAIILFSRPPVENAFKVIDSAYFRRKILRG